MVDNKSRQDYADIKLAMKVFQHPHGHIENYTSRLLLGTAHLQGLMQKQKGRT